MRRPEDSWQGGNPYDRFMGRWSLPVARVVLRWLPPVEDGAWLDVGCGTGVLSRLIVSANRPAEVLAIDASATFIAFARTVNDDARLRFDVAQAESLPAGADRFDAAVSGLALNFVPQPEVAVAEMARVTKPGGVVAAYVWDYAEGMQMLRSFWDAAIALDADAADLDEAVRFPLCREGALERLFVACGLREVTSRAIETTTVFSDFDDFWQPFLGGVGPAPSYVTTLDDARRLALRERLRSNLPTSGDGTIPLTARAWAVRGTV